MGSVNRNISRKSNSYGKNTRTTTTNVIDRFWSKVIKSDECWLWLPKVQRFIMPDGRAPHPSRACYELIYNDMLPLPTQIKVLHRCENYLCVRPEHIHIKKQTFTFADGSIVRRSAVRERLTTLRCKAGKRNEPAPNETTDDIFDMLELQNGMCASCLDALTSRFCIDHCHKTGKVRGLLCISCNSIEGHAKGIPERCEMVAEYMRKTKVAA